MAKDQTSTLRQLLDGDFAEGYAQFKELVDFAEVHPDFTRRERAFTYLYRLVTVAMIEGLNRGEEKFELDPAEMTVTLWHATGAALASVNAQAFKRTAFGKVKKETREAVMSGYQRAIGAFIANADREEASHG